MGKGCVQWTSAYYSRMNQASASPEPPTRKSWLETLKVYLEPASLRMLALGFSAGLPLLLVLGTLSFRLREAGVDRTTIGYLSWVGLGTSGRPHAPARAHALAWAAPQLVAAVAVGGDGRPGRHGADRSAAGPACPGGLCPGGGLRLGHAGHRTGRVSHRIGPQQRAGGAGGVLPDGLPAGHDLGRCRRAVGGGAGRNARCRALSAPGLAACLPGDGRLDGGGPDHRAAVG